MRAAQTRRVSLRFSFRSAVCLAPFLFFTRNANIEASGIVCMGPAAPCGQRQVGRRASPTNATADTGLAMMPSPEGPGLLAADGECFRH